MTVNDTTFTSRQLVLTTDSGVRSYTISFPYFDGSLRVYHYADEELGDPILSGFMIDPLGGDSGTITFDVEPGEDMSPFATVGDQFAVVLLPRLDQILDLDQTERLDVGGIEAALDRLMVIMHYLRSLGGGTGGGGSAGASFDPAIYEFHLDGNVLQMRLRAAPNTVYWTQDLSAFMGGGEAYDDTALRQMIADANMAIQDESVARRTADQTLQGNVDTKLNKDFSDLGTITQANIDNFKTVFGITDGGGEGVSATDRARLDLLTQHSTTLSPSQFDGLFANEVIDYGDRSPEEVSNIRREFISDRVSLQLTQGSPHRFPFNHVTSDNNRLKGLIRMSIMAAMEDAGIADPRHYARTDNSTRTAKIFGYIEIEDTGTSSNDYDEFTVDGQTSNRYSNTDNVGRVVKVVFYWVEDTDNYSQMTEVGWLNSRGIVREFNVNNTNTAFDEDTARSGLVDNLHGGWELSNEVDAKAATLKLRVDLDELLAEVENDREAKILEGIRNPNRVQTNEIQSSTFQRSTSSTEGNGFIPGRGAGSDNVADIGFNTGGGLFLNNTPPVLTSEFNIQFKVGGVNRAGFLYATGTQWISIVVKNGDSNVSGYPENFDLTYTPVGGTEKTVTVTIAALDPLSTTNFGDGDGNNNQYRARYTFVDAGELRDEMEITVSSVVYPTGHGARANRVELVPPPGTLDALQGTLGQKYLHKRGQGRDPIPIDQDLIALLEHDGSDSENPWRLTKLERLRFTETTLEDLNAGDDFYYANQLADLYDGGDTEHLLMTVRKGTTGTNGDWAIYRDYTIDSLTDTPAVAEGQYITKDAEGNWVARNVPSGGEGSATYLGLTDTSSSYPDNGAGFLPQVNANSSGLVFSDTIPRLLEALGSQFLSRNLFGYYDPNGGADIAATIPGHGPHLMGVIAGSQFLTDKLTGIETKSGSGHFTEIRNVSNNLRAGFGTTGNLNGEKVAVILISPTEAWFFEAAGTSDDLTSANRPDALRIDIADDKGMFSFSPSNAPLTIKYKVTNASGVETVEEGKIQRYVPQDHERELNFLDMKIGVHDVRIFPTDNAQGAWQTIEGADGRGVNHESATQKVEGDIGNPYLQLDLDNDRLDKFWTLDEEGNWVSDTFIKEGNSALEAGENALDAVDRLNHRLGYTDQEFAKTVFRGFRPEHRVPANYFGSNRSYIEGVTQNYLITPEGVVYRKRDRQIVGWFRQDFGDQDGVPDTDEQFYSNFVGLHEFKEGSNTVLVTVGHTNALGGNRGWRVFITRLSADPTTYTLTDIRAGQGQLTFHESPNYHYFQNGGDDALRRVADGYSPIGGVVVFTDGSGTDVYVAVPFINEAGSSDHYVMTTVRFTLATNMFTNVTNGAEVELPFTIGQGAISGMVSDFKNVTDPDTLFISFLRGGSLFKRTIALTGTANNHLLEFGDFGAPQDVFVGLNFLSQPVYGLFTDGANIAQGSIRPDPTTGQLSAVRGGSPIAAILVHGIDAGLYLEGAWAVSERPTRVVLTRGATEYTVTITGVSTAPGTLQVNGEALDSHVRLTIDNGDLGTFLAADGPLTGIRAEGGVLTLKLGGDTNQEITAVPTDQDADDLYTNYNTDGNLANFSVSDVTGFYDFSNIGAIERIAENTDRLDDHEDRITLLEESDGGGGGGDVSEELFSMLTGANIRTGVWSNFTLNRALTEDDDERYLYINIAVSSTAENIMHIELPPLKVSRWRLYTNTGGNTGQGEFNAVVAPRGVLGTGLFAHNVYRIARQSDSIIRIASSHNTTYNSIQILLC